MRFEESIDIDAEPQRAWDVLTDIEAWPRRIETVDFVQVLTPLPLAEGSRILLKQPKLPAGTWEITVWDSPSFFEWRQKSGGVTSVAGHRIEALEASRSRLSLSLDMRGLLIPIIGRLSQGLVSRYMSMEAQGMKLAVESAA